MLENPPAMYPSLVGSINGGVDDDVFGEFVFSSPSSSSPIPSLHPYHAPALRQAANAGDEGWGGLFSRPLGSPSFQPHSSFSFSPPLDPCVFLRHQLPLEPSQLSCKGWERPKGAIPLSIFGEEDVEDPEPLERPGVFQNGFASYSLSSHSFPRPSPTGKLNDLVGSPNVQAGSGKEQEDDFDEGSWEFKDAFSAYTRPMTDKGDGAVFGLEMTTPANENGSSLVDVNRLENGCKGMELYKMNNQQYIPSGILATHEKLTDMLLGHNHSVTDEFLHEMLPGFGNGALSIGANGFKLEFPENGIRNESTEEIQADPTEVPYPPEKKEGKDIKWNMWDIDYLNISAFDNDKNLYGRFEDQIEHNTGTEKMDDSSAALTSIMENLYENAEKPHATIPSQSLINNVQEIDQHRKSSVFINGDVDQFDWEFQNATETVEAEKAISDDSGKILSSESTSYTLVEFYCRLKEKSLSLIVHHLAVLKVPALPGATSEVKIINEEIQKVYGKLQEMMSSEDACTSKKTVIPIDQLLNVTKTTNFKAVEHEYRLSERLLASEKDLNAAVELFVHSSSVLHILRLASKEQQLFYINAWSKLASACAQELQLGAKIWTESLEHNISKQLLIKGNKYFIALGEVFRLSKILKATVTFYIPWLLSNPEYSSEIVICLEKGNEAWINTGLKEILRTISVDTDLDVMGLTKSLLESIKLIDKAIVPTYQDPVFHDKLGVCKFFLLPLDKLPEIKSVFWNGDCYVTKLVNFWANRISPVPPELPSIMPS